MPKLDLTTEEINQLWRTLQEYDIIEHEQSTRLSVEDQADLERLLYEIICIIRPHINKLYNEVI